MIQESEITMAQGRAVAPENIRGRIVAVATVVEAAAPGVRARSDWPASHSGGRSALGPWPAPATFL